MRRLLVPTILLALVACDRPTAEPFPPDGNAAAPQGIVEGTLLYAGPRPRCLYDGQGQPVHALGRVVLTLFRYDDPPPPEGSATSAANLLALPAAALFPDTADCMPEDPEPADLAPIMRSAAFTWPELTLGADYQIRGFFDTDEDFNPFYSVRNLPTKGDVAGGAFEDPNAAVRVYRRISFGAGAAGGERVSGVTVSLGAPVNTERPMFSLDGGTEPLDGEATLPIDPSPLDREANLWGLTKARLNLVPANDPAWTSTLGTAGIDLDFDPRGYAFFVKPVDADGDGVQDDHPVLGSAGIKWTTPIFILERGRTAAERAAGVPRVLLIGSTRPTQTAFKQVFSPSIYMLVPPVAVVDLNPAYPSCRVPYIPPGNLAPMYEGLPSECQEVPSGWYSMSVLQGVAGGRVTDGAEAAFSDTGYLLEGGAFSGQAWSIPNELGPPDPVFGPVMTAQLDAGFLRPSQGERFRVYDGKPVDGVRHDCGSALDPTTGTMRSVSPTPVPDRCCEAVRHLCDLPLCAAAADNGVRGSTTKPDGSLACVPFEMPASCCNGGV